MFYDFVVDDMDSFILIVCDGVFVYNGLFVVERLWRSWDFCFLDGYELWNFCYGEIVVYYV